MNRIVRCSGIAVLMAGIAFASAQNQSPGQTNQALAIPSGAPLPRWPRVAAFDAGPGLASSRSGDLEIVQAKSPLAGFLVRVGGKNVAVGSPPQTIGYLHDGQVQWLQCTDAALKNQKITADRSTIRCAYECADKQGATWKVVQEIRAMPPGAAFEVQTEVSTSEDRAVAFLPMILLYPGVGSFGTAKDQGLFAGLEYLEDEPSSSEADVIGPAAKRLVPDPAKLTFPLMAIQGAGAYVALTWQMRPQFAPLFDSPDRLFQSGGHLMGLLFPGSSPAERAEGSLLPRMAELLHADETVTLRATILGGAGTSVVPAVQAFVKRRSLPPLPTSLNSTEYLAQASGGWLDSKIRQGALLRHAVAEGGFKPQPAADAALWMEWLAAHDSDPALRTRLEQTSTNVLSAVPAEDYNLAGVGHIRYPVESLVFGEVARNAEQARARGKTLLARFTPDGGVEYHPVAGGIDLGKTHSSNQANGLASRVVEDLLEAAAFCGDRELIETGLQHLRALDKFHLGVPRGAQTWECPLHTPDILASAQMVRCYTLGYELTGETHFLEEARYWAWTGVPFVYLVSPTNAPVGLYATIAVYGATQWRAPVWLGLPVQWCGLVYADALNRLESYDPAGPWKRLAQGITLSGIQQSWTDADADLQGLLPDSFVLPQQKRNGPAINPATLQACAARYFDPLPVYQFHCFRTNSLLVHAPGEIRAHTESKGHVSFRVNSWMKRPYFVLVNGLTKAPSLTINGREEPCSSPHQFVQQQGWLILRLENSALVGLSL